MEEVKQDNGAAEEQPKKEKPAKKPKEKKQKQPKPKKAPAPKGKKPAKKKKGKEGEEAKGGGSGAIILVLVLVLLVLMGIASIWFNIGGMRDKTIALLQSADPAAVDENGMTEIDRREVAADEKMQEAEAAIAEIDKIKADLEKRQESIATRETELSDLAKQILGQQKSIQEVAAIYAAMNASQAAETLSSIKNVQNISIIIQNVDERAAAKILAAMDPELAGRVTLQMMDTANPVDEGD